MYTNHKKLTWGVVSAAVLLTATAAAWAESDCDTQSCNQMYAQLAQLKTQLDATHAQVAKLESALTFVRQDVGALQSSKAGMRMMTAAQVARNGRGIRNRNAYPN